MPANDIRLALHRWLAGLRDASGKDVTVTTTGRANPMLPNATLHRVELLIVFPKGVFQLNAKLP